MQFSNDIVKKTALVLIVLVALGAGSYFLNRAPVEGMLPTKPEPVEIKRSVIIEDTAPENRRFASDIDAMDALKQCEAEKLTIDVCKQKLAALYDVTAVAPRNVGADGFAGFLIFPIKNGGNIVMDYNTVNYKEQMLFFGSFSDLQLAVAKDGMGEPLTARVRSIKREIE